VRLLWGKSNGARRDGHVTVSMAQFILSGVAALVVVAVGGATVLDRIGRAEAIRSAREVTRLVGGGAEGGLLGKYITLDLMDPSAPKHEGALTTLDKMIRENVLQDPVVRVKIWVNEGNDEGRILYSDEPRLIGESYPLDEDKREAFASGAGYAEVSKLDGEENRFEHSYGKLLEVYLPIHSRTATRNQLLIETYQRYSSVAASGRRTWTAFGPVLLAALVLLELIQVPLARSLTARLRDRQQEREGLLKRAIEASEIERRRIAGDLHDGVVQQLAGLSYKLAAASTRAAAGGNGELGTALSEAAADTRLSIRQLRSLLVEIHPPNIHSVGLQAALSGLLAPLSSRGVATRLEVEVGDLAPELEVLLFRVAQEGLHNVVRHAAASSVIVTVNATDDAVTLVVSDDGRGFSAADRARKSAEGHMGLRLLADLAADHGGRFEVDSEPGAGTLLRLQAPLA
jgi:two-component system, NarL family, sensor kinase